INASEELATDYSQRAAAYSRFWAPVINPMANPLLLAMPLAGSRRILDVGTGTGALWPLIERAAPGAELYGVDRAEGMLREGDDLLRGRVAVADAANLGIRPAVFDAALLLFVLFHIPDPVRALGEIRATLRPGGSVGLVVWGEDPGLPAAAFWAEELDRAGAVADSRDSSVMRQCWMDTTGKLADLVKAAGFNSHRVWTQHFAHRWNVENLFATQTQCGLPSRRLSSLGPDAREVCVNRVRARMETLTMSELEYRVEVIYAIAHRP
ncbi:MAG TPA: class I SAM-dependent methyltransferase, partial [Gemmatimonadaceae bacterium]|nr:class I SAM-dependent methyltransferase [Gemmatimonadaceae bacterium]